MLTTKELEKRTCEIFNLDRKEDAQDYVNSLIEWTEADSSFLIDSIIEAGKDLLPPGITDQMWTGFVLGHFAGYNIRSEEDED